MAGKRKQKDAASSPPVCAWCGTVADVATPASWSMQTSERGVQVLCDACTRANVRSIEAKLPGEYW